MLNKLGLIIMLLAVFSCKETTKREVKTAKIDFTKEGELQLFRAETDSLLANLDIEIADTDYETQTGLMYRNGMKPNQGMLFIFESTALHSFYMKNTQFSLDVVFINEGLKVIKIHSNTDPFSEESLPSGGAVKYVLETNAGITQNWGLKEGDSISFARDLK